VTNLWIIFEGLTVLMDKKSSLWFARNIFLVKIINFVEIELSKMSNSVKIMSEADYTKKSVIFTKKNPPKYRNISKIIYFSQQENVLGEQSIFLVHQNLIFTLPKVS
jgi:hypothetical protein